MQLCVSFVYLFASTMRSERLHGDKDISFHYIIVQKGEFYLAHWGIIPTTDVKITSLVQIGM